MYSLLSRYGPSVSSGLPLRASTVVVALWSCRPPANTKMPSSMAFWFTAPPRPRSLSISSRGGCASRVRCTRRPGTATWLVSLAREQSQRPLSSIPRTATVRSDKSRICRDGSQRRARFSIGLMSAPIRRGGQRGDPAEAGAGGLAASDSRDLRRGTRPHGSAPGHAMWRDRPRQVVRRAPAKPARSGGSAARDRASVLALRPTLALHRAARARGSERGVRAANGSWRDHQDPSDRLGAATRPVGGRLAVWWLEQYGGGIFVPFRDATAGTSTYGAGRYLLDTAKGADLGLDGDRIVLDFNFSYHPSCRYDPAWQCPLAPPENVLTAAIEAGERLS